MSVQHRNKDPFIAIIQGLQLVTALVMLVALLALIIALEASTHFLANIFSGDNLSVKEEVMSSNKTTMAVIPPVKFPANIWIAPDTTGLSKTTEGQQILYGRELIANTAHYLGPKGTILQISNGLNCQNCHLGAGTVPYGNNYGSVASTYPKVRARSGKKETIQRRINDCFERSLNGNALPEGSKEMQAMVSYMKWLGKDTPKGKKVAGSGLLELDYLNRPADPKKGKPLYEAKCANCHGKNGEGQKVENASVWIYPPLWGENSFNQGAGLFRLSRMAGYIKVNMPLGATYQKPQLTDEEAWDIAAYIESMPRPTKNLSEDWPDISKKPIDHPFGPFKDSFTEEQHKFGPFKPIIAQRESK